MFLYNLFLPFALLVLICDQAYFASAVPLPPPLNSTDGTLGWVSDPNYRSTQSIITSCVLTLGLCVWSALHLNVPPGGETFGRCCLRNTKWILIGCFGPELVVFAAWRQYVSARAIQGIKNKRKQLTGTRNVSQDSQLAQIHRHDAAEETKTAADQVRTDSSASRVSQSDEEPDWSVVHGFYAAMGGFVFELDSDTAYALSLPPSAPYRLTVTPRGLLLLAECNLLPKITRQEIDDKSKADGLAKAVVCLQAGWMVLQTIARVASDLPVTLLEVNTIGHVICTMLIYALWWHKPRLIMEPTILRGPWVPAICAYMWMSSRISDGQSYARWGIFDPSGIPELGKLVFVEESAVRTNANPPSQSSEGSHPRARTIQVSSSKNIRGGDTEPHLMHSAHRQNYGYLGHRNEFERFAEKSAIQDFESLPELSKDVPSRWDLALEAMQTFPFLRLHMDQLHSQIENKGRQFRSEVLVQETQGNWESRSLLTAFNGVVMGMALWFASIAYGAVHAAAWNEYFPSRIECWLWRTGSVYVMGSGLLWLAINFGANVWPAFDNYWERVLARQASHAIYIALGVICSLCGIAYAFARAFLVVESFISLRRLPVAAYGTPNWSQLIPHL